MGNKKVFIFSPIPIFPVVAANQKDIFGHILLFKELGYDITLFCYVRQRYINDFAVNLKNAQKYSINIEFLEKKKEKANKYTSWDQVGLLINDAAIRTIQSSINKEQPDILFFEYTRFAYLCSLLKTSNSKIIFRVHNFELLHDYDKTKINTKNGFYNWLKMVKNSQRRWLSILASERLMLKISDKILCISWGDSKLYRKIFNTKKIIYLPPYLGNLKEVKVKEKEILDVFYTGSNYRNNVNRSGADYLIDKIIPLVNKKFPRKFRFHIVGKYSKEIYCNTRIVNLFIHDFIEDIESFYDKMDIACIPVKGGRGCKIKMLEALQKGIPTVGFRRTFSGIPFEENCFISAENEKEYVNAFEKLLSLSVRQKLYRSSKKKITALINKERLLSCLKNLEL
ncbi:MAG: glycosyltransferase [Candidatus Hodarchaeota archaeon]